MCFDTFDGTTATLLVIAFEKVIQPKNQIDTLRGIHAFLVLSSSYLDTGMCRKVQKFALNSFGLHSRFLSEVSMKKATSLKNFANQNYSWQL